MGGGIFSAKLSQNIIEAFDRVWRFWFWWTLSLWLLIIGRTVCVHVRIIVRVSWPVYVIDKSLARRRWRWWRWCILSRYVGHWICLGSSPAYSKNQNGEKQRKKKKDFLKNVNVKSIHFVDLWFIHVEFKIQVWLRSFWYEERSVGSLFLCLLVVLFCFVFVFVSLFVCFCFCFCFFFIKEIYIFAFI